MLARLDLENFRSYEAGSFELDPEVTLVVGPNASGKTNLLESLYVIASTKSFRANDRDLIRYGQEYFRIKAASDEVEFVLGVSTAGGKMEKRVIQDGAKKPLSSHVGKIQVVLFEPRDLAMLSGPPDGRRRYLDFVLCQTDAGYLKTLQQYRRVLAQRNAVLEGENMSRVRDEIFAWDIKLAELASEIYARRVGLIELLGQIVPEQYRGISADEAAIEIKYLPSVEGNYAERFAEALSRNLPRDLAAGFTTIGPHREDFKVRFKNNDITSVASRGEERTVVLAMKLAELEYAESKTGVRPLLLLDDVFSELDRDRRGYLMARLKGYQTVITTTDADSVAADLPVSHGVINTGKTANA
jgi:DNA replication and repair protein RecF